MARTETTLDPVDPITRRRYALMERMRSTLDALSGSLPADAQCILIVADVNAPLGQLIHAATTEGAPNAAGDAADDDMAGGPRGKALVAGMDVATARETLHGFDPTLDTWIEMDPPDGMMAVVVDAFDGASLFMVRRPTRAESPS